MGEDDGVIRGCPQNEDTSEQQNPSHERLVGSQDSVRISSETSDQEFDVSIDGSVLSSAEIARDCIIVLGMHRSGTSALTRVLSLLGVDLPKDIMGDGPGNERGHWEPEPIVEFNDKLLRRLDGSWDDWRHQDIDPCALPEIAQVEHEISCLLDTQYPASTCFVLKDPRICRLVPIYARIFLKKNIRPRYVLIYRNPLAVIGSLHDRNGIAPGIASLLWLRHILDAEVATRESGRAIVSFERLMSSWGEVVRDIGTRIGVRWPVPPQDAKHKIENFLSRDLQHHAPSRRELAARGDIAALVKDAYSAMCDLETDLDDAAAIARLDGIRATLDVVEPLLAGVSHGVHERVESQVRELDALRQFLAETQASNDAQSRELDSLRQFLAETQASNDAQSRELDSLRQFLAETQAGNEAQSRELDGLHKSLAEREASYQSLVTSLRARCEALELDNAAHVRQREDLRRTYVEAQEARARLQYALDATHSSTSWRITAPMRALKTRLSFLCSFPEAAARASGISTSLVPLRIGYHLLPLRAETKEDLKTYFYSRFPRLLKDLKSYEMWERRQEARRASVPRGLEKAEVVAPDLDTIKFVATAEPLVSVIIPVYGQLEYTLRCLWSIARHSPRVPFEIIVVDDASADQTCEVLRKVQGVRLLENPQNLGFLRSCNRGAASARGKYLCFLNNDTEVHPDWLDELVRTFDEFPGAGLVGSKLIYPDGTLQEAGGIIWQDGSAWNFGRGQKADLPLYNYARQVDYCSGASILVPRDLFNDLGGFDEHYLPAYCEDADLALKIRACGLSVIYQPMSVVTHYEGVTSGTDLKSGVKAHQVTNTKKLFERWRPRLARHEPNNVNVDCAKDRGVKLRALVLDHCTPTPDQDAGSLVTANVLRLLRQMGFQVTFIPEDNFLYMPPYTTDLQRAGIEVLYYPFQRTVLEHLREHGARYDVVLLWRPVVADRHLKDLKTYSPRAKFVYGAADLHFLRMMREADLANDAELKDSARLMRDSELATMKSADAVIVHSTAEERIVRDEVPGCNVHVFPLIMGTRRSAPPPAGRSNVAFVGGFQHQPNIDAVEFFVADVLPHLRKVHPEIKFYAIGSKPPERVKNLASEHVIVTGLVQDLAPLLDTMRVGVATLRYGAGAKGKVATALSLGLPMVLTPVAAEGMGLVHGEHVLIGKDGAEIAEHIGRLYSDDALWGKLSANGLGYADATFGPSAARKSMGTVLGSVGVDGVATDEQDDSDRWMTRPRARAPRALRLLDSTGRPAAG